MSKVELLAPLRVDAARYPRDIHAGLIAVAAYRFARYARHGEGARLPRLLAMAGAIVLAVLCRLVNASRIPASAQIGAGLWLPHPHGITIHANAVIGERAVIFQHVTIGQLHGDAHAVPCIGDGVTLFPGAVLVGGIGVGAGASVGANAVVTFNVPAGAVVKPARASVEPSAVD